MTIYTDTLKEAIASAKVYLRCLEEHLEQAEAGESTDDDDGWIAWHGGECPFTEPTTVDVKFRGGETYRNRRAHNFSWAHAYYEEDIIAYRIVK